MGQRDRGEHHSSPFPVSCRKKETERGQRRAIMTVGCAAAAPHLFQLLPSWNLYRRFIKEAPERSTDEVS